MPGTESDSNVQAITDRFHQVWYDSRVWERIAWMGIPIQKNPFDLFQYQEILSEERPDVLIECGAYKGGATLFFAQMFDLIGHGKVISIDTVPRWAPVARDHPRVTTLTGRSVDRKIFSRVLRIVRDGTAMVVLDSDHTQQYVEEELALYSQLIKPGGLIVVEDTDVNAHPVYPDHGPGPFEAVQTFLDGHKEFLPDESRAHRLLFTSAPSGWLRRVRSGIGL
jgi:cephalosporin hydroxylase